MPIFLGIWIYDRIDIFLYFSQISDIHIYNKDDENYENFKDQALKKLLFLGCGFKPLPVYFY